MDKAVAIVVTYNRKALLIECLSAVRGQTVKPAAIIVVDNHSTDGTEQYLKSIENPYGECALINLRMPRNTGGAGGFYEGMKYASTKFADCHLWLMDDDTIPDADCLEKLLSARERILNRDPDSRIAYLSSTVLAPNRQDPMNVPIVDTRPSQNDYPTYGQHLDLGVVKTTEATFVSILVTADAARKCGLPCKDYFIWGDDTEYTLRLTRHYGDGYLVGDSRAIHKRAGSKMFSILTEEDVLRIPLYYYFYRNFYINSWIYYGRTKSVRLFIGVIRKLIPLLSHRNGGLKFRTAVKGVYDAWFHSGHLVDFINGQISKAK